MKVILPLFLLFCCSHWALPLSLEGISKSTLLPPTTKKCTNETKASSLTYLVDTTSSMGDDLVELNIVNDWLLERALARFPCGVREYTMVEYNDPDIGPVRKTGSKTEFAEFFKKIKPYGGLIDCPELAMGGLKLALESSPPYSFILVLTDASAKDFYDMTLVNSIYSLIAKKQIEVYFLITGLCASGKDPGFQIYRNIALKSFGQVFQVSVSEIGEAFQYLDFMLSRPVNSSTPIFAKDYPAGTHSDSFDVKENHTALVIRYNGPVTSIALTAPNGSLINPTMDTNPIGSVIQVTTNLDKGQWRVSVTASEEHSIRISGSKETNVSATLDCSQCHPDATCEQYSGGKRCSCKKGYLGDGFHCSDINECAQSWTNTCPDKCVNMIGSYSCGCHIGYKESGEECLDINECLFPNLHSCHSFASCTNTLGSYSCSCPYGYYGDGKHCEVDECTTDACGKDMDCIKQRGSYSCLDPCMKHTTMNEPWRSTDSPGDNYCDKDKSGWYRFIGIGGIRIPEECVTGQNCSTEAPIWINGPHPSQGDGIVKLTACAHYDGDCCHWSTTVLVKACPIGYHVYKLSETPKCPFAYCTDPNSLDESCPCAENEERKLLNGAYGCYCKDGSEDIGIEDLEFDLKCSTKEMKASFRACQLKHFHVRSIHLSNSSCVAVKEVDNNGLITATCPLQDGVCGTQLYTNGTHAMYKNTIYVQLETETEQLIIRDNDAERSFTCLYALDLEIGLNPSLTAVMSAQTFEVAGQGTFTVHMRIYKDGSFQSAYNTTSVTLSTNKRVYVGVSLEDQTNSQYAVVMKKCYATPSNHANDSVQYPIIKNKCPNRRDKSIRVIQNGVSTKGQFSLHMFKFIGNGNQVYLHCEVNICDLRKGPCKPSCSGIRTNGNITEESSITVKCGPIAR